jgi:hypothetical protein
VAQVREDERAVLVRDGRDAAQVGQVGGSVRDVADQDERRAV